ncbi:S-layer homology domain-containing protein [Halobacillus litoralis]|uniref:SLH domain-containing protein n=1 Tax=Halobacillus litoralis TaxID=45668 RepID=A0A410MFF2_9BACI|nr:S-layer homology domain-containing protein [Halobacillus litoralis]QAS53420.1 hypothetical protein HLI_15050 [Halobacillus litoralis]
MSYQPKSNRKFYATALTTAVVASAVAPVAVSADHVFPDVEDGEYYSDAVQYLADNAVLQGNEEGNFNPEGNIIRASAAEVLMKAQSIVPGGTEDFSDVDEDDWFYNAVRATSPAIFEGNGDGMFVPDRELTRQEAAAIIVRAYDLSGGEDHPFSDVEKGSWAEDDIAVAYENGIIKGNGEGEFMPEDNVTRKDFAVMVYRAMGEPTLDVTVESTTVIDANTLEVTWSNDETTEVSLEEALVNGENEVTFEVDGEEYTVTVNYDAVTPAVEAAETAIAELPEELTLEDAETVEAARALVETVYELDEDAEIEGLETLVTAEETIAALEAEAAAVAEATEAVETAEETLLEEDLADAQELVAELSDSDDKVLLNARLVNVQDQLDSIIEAVNTAEGELETFRALDVKPFENVNEDYITDYVTALDDYVTANGEFETAADIQGVIDAVNKTNLDAELKSDVDAANDAVDSVEAVDFTADNFDQDAFDVLVNEAQAAIDELPSDYKVEEDDDAPLAETLQNDLDEAVELASNYQNVVEPVVDAGNQVDLYNALVENFDNVVEENIGEYDFTDFTTVEEVQYEINFVNASETIDAFEVDADTTQEDIDALKALVPMTGEEDDDGNATPTDAEQELLNAVDAYQTEFDNLTKATEDLTKAVTAAEAALDAYLAAGGDEEDTVYTDVEAELEDAENVDFDSETSLTTATGELTTATGALETATDNMASLNEAVTAAESAQEAYLAAGGEEEDGLYQAVTDALDADPQVEADIESATTDLEVATAELELVSSINDAETAEELATALVNLENDNFNNLTSTQRLEVAEWFMTTVEDQDPAYSDSTVISTDLSDEISNVDGDGYLDLLAGVNGATSITTADEALEALNIEEYEALSAAEQLDAAENVWNNQPEGGYTSISSIVANF